jgi:hypothetical protein
MNPRNMFCLLGLVTGMLFASTCQAQYCDNGVCYSSNGQSQRQPIRNVVRQTIVQPVQQVTQIAVQPVVRTVQAVPRVIYGQQLYNRRVVYAQPKSPSNNCTCTNCQCSTSPGATTGAVVNKDPAMFAHAQREAQIQAKMGTLAHFLGTAPGARGSGVGVSSSINQPSHCVRGRELIARAYAVSGNGRVYWSAHYR